MTKTITTQHLAPYLQAQRSARASAIALLTLLFGPPALLLGALLYGIARLLNRGSVWIGLGVGAAVGLAVLGLQWQLLWEAVQALGNAVWPLAEALRQGMRGRDVNLDWPVIASDAAQAIWRLWRWGLLGSPLLALYLHGTRLKTLREQEAATQNQETRQLAQRSRQATKRAAAAPLVVEGQLILGAPITGDLDWRCRGYLPYPPDVLGRHLVLVGASGQGKSETAVRLAAGAAAAYGWQVFFLDAKGDLAMAARFWAAMQAGGKTNLAMMPSRPFDVWRGDSTALLNRLLSVLEWSEPYYRDLTKMVLSLALDAPQGPPRSSPELLGRLNRERLHELYAGHPDGAELGGLKAEQIAATYNRYRAFFRALQGQVDGDWSWEDVETGYLLLDGLALKDQSVSLGRVLLEDFAHYVARRKPSDRRVLLIVDEFSALSLGGTDAASLFERVRSYGTSVVVTAQSYAGLGQGADRILGAAAAVLLHQCPDPEILITRAGQVSERQLRQGGTERVTLGGIRTYATGQVSAVTQERAKVRPELVQQLGVGEAVLICGGQASRLRISQVPLDTPAIEAAYAEMAAQPQRQLTAPAPEPTVTGATSSSSRSPGVEEAPALADPPPTPEPEREPASNPHQRPRVSSVVDDDDGALQ
jgi:hypothetical protein